MSSQLRPWRWADLHLSLCPGRCEWLGWRLLGKEKGVASGEGMVCKGKVEGKGILRDAELWFGE